ncbi:MAG: trimeric intracellular cation channel family protein [bacterium]
MIYLFILEIIGTIAFTIGASVLAIKSKMDVLGVIILSIIAALGGGLMRDVILHKDIVLFEEPIYLIITVITSLIIFITFYFIKKTDFFDNKYFNIFLNIMDGIGLGVFVVVGANAALNLTSNLLFIVFCALITGVGGGVVRDLMINRIPVIFRKHIYALAALVGIIIYLIFSHYNLELLGSVTAIVSITIIRILSQHFELSLPKIKI